MPTTLRALLSQELEKQITDTRTAFKKLYAIKGKNYRCPISTTVFVLAMERLLENMRFLAGNIEVNATSRGWEVVGVDGEGLGDARQLQRQEIVKQWQVYTTLVKRFNQMLQEANVERSVYLQHVNLMMQPTVDVESAPAAARAQLAMAQPLLMDRADHEEAGISAAPAAGAPVVVGLPVHGWGESVQDLLARMDAQHAPTAAEQGAEVAQAVSEGCANSCEVIGGCVMIFGFPAIAAVAYVGFTVYGQLVDNTSSFHQQVAKAFLPLCVVAYAGLGLRILAVLKQKLWQMAQGVNTGLHGVGFGLVSAATAAVYYALTLPAWAGPHTAIFSVPFVWLTMNFLFDYCASKFGWKSATENDRVFPSEQNLQAFATTTTEQLNQLTNTFCLFLVAKNEVQDVGKLPLFWRIVYAMVNFRMTSAVEKDLFACANALFQQAPAAKFERRHGNLVASLNHRLFFTVRQTANAFLGAANQLRLSPLVPGRA